MIGWMCSYIGGLAVPLLNIFIVWANKYYVVGYVWTAIMMVYKAVIPFLVGLMAWNHLGQCYIPTAMKWTIIGTNVLELICYIIELVLVVRAKRINR